MASKEESSGQNFPPRVTRKAIVRHREKETDISGSKEKLDSDLTCAVCQSTYSDPRLLSCLHSFCKQCLLKLVGMTEVHGGKRPNLLSIKCPLCRNEHILYSKMGVDDLMPNTQLASKLECFLPVAPQPSCGECEAANVFSFCENCQNYLCELCDQAHKRMVCFKTHLVVSPDQAKTKPKAKKFMCCFHSSESLDIYCTDCKVVVCRECTIFGHNGHHFKRVVDVSENIKSSLIRESMQLSAQLIKFRSHAKEIAEAERHVTVYPDKMKSFIISQFDELHKLLDKRKEALLKQVDTQYNGFSKTLWAEKNIIEMGICKLEAGIKFANQLTMSDDKQEVAVLGIDAVNSMKKMSSLSWDPKAIKNLGPLIYMARERDASFQHLSDKDFMESIGKLGDVPNIVIVITSKGYEKPVTLAEGLLPPGSVALQINDTYHLEVQAQGCKVLFPSASISCTCTIMKEMTAVTGVACNTMMQSENKWAISFQTVKPGKYFIAVTLKLNGEVHCRKNGCIVFVQPVITFS